MLKIGVGLFGALLAFGQAAASEPAFAGRWDCGVQVFQFTSRTYNNGAKTMKFSSIEFGKGNDVRLVLPDGYVVALLNITRRTMIWSSPASGSTFDCKRLR
ncbi:hypothetical protein OIU35_15270 [Boseaceae bacterium BT-24-1]|nr:hypothetical protein [Boseaceae bacterium BT-24-1]